MTDKAKQPQATADGAVELEESRLEDAAGGFSWGESAGPPVKVIQKIAPIGGIVDGTSNIIDGTSNTRR